MGPLRIQTGHTALRRVFCSLAVGTVLLLAGCGDRSQESSASAPTRAQAPTPPAQTAASTTPSAPGASAPQLITPPPAVKERLRVEVVTTRAIPLQVTAPGEVALDLKQVAKVTSRIEGQAERIHVQLGDRVKAGQPLAAIGSLQFDQLIEEYLVSKAQADVAENNFRRTEKLRASDVVPERKLVEDKGRYLETSARHQHIREKLLNMGLTTQELTGLERGRHQEGHLYSLTAPIGGTIVAQRAVRGQGVAPGQELFEIVDTSRVWIFANLPIEQARLFKEGDLATISPKGAAAISAPLTYLSPVADETTRTIQVRFEAANADGRLKPREYVDVTLTLPGAAAVAVPTTAITMVDQTRGVFLEQEGAYRFTPIDSGREGGGWVEVTRGVRDGDRVVVDGVFDLKNVLLKAHIGSGD
ncbi:MAG: efflux RND transporter periplasmic adaptor subunit [Nitrospiraceae bacterium]